MLDYGRVKSETRKMPAFQHEGVRKYHDRGVDFQYTFSFESYTCGEADYSGADVCLRMLSVIDFHYISWIPI